MRLVQTRKNPNFFRALRRVVIAVALAALVLPTGCVRRRLNVRSNPPGALVFVDNQQIGTTPCSVDFTYYGTREIRLVKPGYETLTVNQPIPTPWYQIPPIDFVSDNLLLNKIEDHRTVAFNLEPQIIVPTEQLIERGNQLRQETLAGAAAAAAPPTVIVPGAASIVTPGTTPAPILAPPDTFAPAPSLAPPPAGQPVPLPPVTNSPAVQQPITQPPLTSPPSGQSLPSTSGSSPATPFSPPALPSIPPAGSQQQGPAIVSPPLR